MNNYTIPEQGFVYADELKPVSLDAERALIGCVLRGGRETMERVREIVRGEMFWSESHQAVWAALERLYSEGLHLDVIVAGDEMERMQKIGELEREWGDGIRNGRAYLSDLRASGDPRHAETYAEQVQDYHFKRYLLQFSGKIGGWAANGRRAREIIQDVESEFSRMQIYSTQDEYTVPISVGVSEAYDWVDRAARGEIVGIPTGLIDLDNIIGTLINGNVYLIAGRPGQGKTGVLLSVARNAARRRKRICILSLEMSRMQVSQRLIAQEAEIDLQSLIQGTLRDSDWPKFTNAVEVVADYSISINDLSSINISQIRQTARKIKAASGLDLLIVDYIQLAAGDGKKYERRDLEVSAVSRGLKYLARELDIPILAAAQLSRAVEQRQDKKPILSDLRESGSLEQDAYAVIFMYEKDGMIHLEVAKHRNGPTGDCTLYFNRPFVRFDNLQLYAPAEGRPE